MAKSVSLSVGRGEKLPTKQGAGLTAKGRERYNRETGSNLKAPAPKPEEPKEKAEFYEIVKGDTLGAIAKKYYGSAGKYMKIFEANRDIISDPNKIYPGQKIKIPLD